MTPAHRAARIYAERYGLHVFPLVGKRPLAGTRGLYDASADPAVIDAAFAGRKDLNVGIWPGPSDVAVIDIDTNPRSGGMDAFAEFCEVFGEQPETPVVLTGGGGSHVYLRVPAGVHFVSTLQCGAGSFEVKCRGNYVVAPPSVHPVTGRRYEWEASMRIDEVPMANMPQRWINALSCDAPRMQGPVEGDVVSAPIYALAKEWGVLGEVLNGGAKASVRCPWQHEHSDHNPSRVGHKPTSTSAIFAAQSPLEWGGFKCKHGHCDGRTGRDFVAAAPIELQKKHSPLARW